MGIFVILILTDLFIWWRLFIDFRNRSRIALVLAGVVKLFLTVILLWLIISIVLYKGEFATPANAFRFIVFGTVSALTLVLGITYSLISICSRLLSRLLHRRMSGVVWINLAMAGLIVTIFADGYFRQRFELNTVRYEIAVDNLDPGLEGLKIALMSDLHLSSYYGHYDRLEEVIDSVNAFKPDLLFNTGDFITYGWQEFGACDTILKRSVASIGSFAVAGNHDDGTYYPDYDESYGEQCAEMIKKKVTASGYLLLTDSSMTVSRNGAEVMIAGVVTHGHHLNIRYGDFERALAGSDTSDLTILLIHDPAAWNTVRALPGDVDLMLSGHTHGMQIGLPTPRGVISPASIFHKYWRGHYEFNGRHLYVTTGLGSMGMAERIFMPPEIVLLTLQAK